MQTLTTICGEKIRLDPKEDQDLKDFISYDPNDTEGIAARTYELWQYLRLQPEERK